MVSKRRLREDYDLLEEELFDNNDKADARIKELEDTAVERGYQLLAAKQALKAAEKERDQLRGQLSRAREAHDHLHRQLYPLPAGSPILPPSILTPLPPGLATGTFMNTSS